MTLFPSLEEAIELHKNVIDRFGGSHGIRDVGLLESALYRPQTGYYEDLATMTAALLESLLMNHCFVDGNKRVGFFLADIFLRMNGYKISVEAKVGQKFIEDTVVKSEKRFERIVKWLNGHIEPLAEK